MIEGAFVPLGGRDWPAAVGRKAARLHAASRSGLPVPDGGLLLVDAPQHADCSALVAALPARLRRGQVAVRSAFRSEDGTARSLAGAFHSELGVDAADDRALAAAIGRVVDSATRIPALVPGRCDVLVQRMVAARHAGVAFTEADFEDDLVEWVDGTADGLVAGRRAGVRCELPKLEPLERPTAAEPFLARLQRLLRAVRRVFGPGDHDVEWADDGRRCWLLQCRPVTASPGRDELFTVANHKEILPELPSRTMVSVMAERAEALFGWYRAHDSGLPAGRPFLEVFRGRPRINLSLLIDTLRRLGLPTRLVTASIGGDHLAGHPLRPLRMLRRAGALWRLSRAQRRAVRDARRIAARIAELASDARCTDFRATLDALGACYVELVHGMFALTAAMSLPLALLRWLGVLQAWSARHRTASTLLLDELQRLRASLAPSAADRERMRAGRLPAEPDTRAAVAELLARHGHRGPFESDVARPRFADEPGPLLRALVAPGTAAVSGRPPLGVLGRLAAPLWWLARGPLAARERLRDDAMRAFGSLRARLAELAVRAAESGRLPAPEAVWDLSADDLRAVDAGPGVDAATWAERRADQAAFAAAPLPDLFRRRGLLAVADAAGSDDTLRGLGLTAGVVEGRAWLVSDPTAEPPDAVDGAPIILVAPAVDAGWIPLFCRVAAVLVELGGELSHGSIVLREAGVPAITDLRDASRALRDGQRVRVDARAGTVTPLTDPGAAGPP
ncbi:MAG: hypothetical protein IPM29_18175 [Planctomycetes bacterium]|nr:hypothetical protein [Planctomycetota bacterium]